MKQLMVRFIWAYHQICLCVIQRILIDMMNNRACRKVPTKGFLSNGYVYRHIPAQVKSSCIHILRSSSH